MNGNSNRSTGRFGENVVCCYLKKQGIGILERNYYTKHGEIDIIAEDDSHIIFIEVKTRFENELMAKYGRPAAAVNRVKRQHILYAANSYLRENKYRTHKTIRLDVAEVYLSVIGDNEPQFYSARINYIKSAFSR